MSLKPRVLILKNTRFLSKENANVRKYRLFSERLEGVIIQRILNESFSEFKVGAFNFRGICVPRWIDRIKPLSHLYFFIVSLLKAVAVNRENKIEFVLASDPFSAGIMGLAIARIIRAKLIVEINGNFGDQKTWGVGSGRFIGTLKYHYCQFVVPFVTSNAFGVKLLYPTQLDSFVRKVKNENIHVFHEFVPVSDFAVSQNSEGYILLLGKPWHVKGVDLLIKAFYSICSNYSGKLRIVGAMSAKEVAFLKGMIPENDKIIYEKPVYYDDAQALISRCDFLVLPSRTEAMGRVLMEARAHGKAVIASNADGIPTYVEHDKTGLLFQSGDWRDLKAQLERMISEEGLKERLAKQGNHVVLSQFDEQSYLQHYMELLNLEFVHE